MIPPRPLASSLFVLPVSMLILGCSRGSANADSVARADSARAAGIPSGAGDTSLSRAGTPDSASLRTDTQSAASRPTPPDPSGSKTGGRTPPPPPPPAGDSTKIRSDAADTARGIVAVVGTSFDSRVILRPAGGGRSITLLGPQATVVGRLSGTDVAVMGSRDASGQITVSRFVVRAVNGKPALDGTLVTRGDKLLIVTRDGKQHPIDNPPTGLQERVGARVWIVGDRPPITFGVIEERR